MCVACFFFFESFYGLFMRQTLRSTTEYVQVGAILLPEPHTNHLNPISVENKQLFEATGDDAHVPGRKAGSDLSVDNGSNNSNCSNDSN